MIKIIKYSSRTGHNKLLNFLDQRRNSNNSDVDLVNKIINDVKKNKFSTLKRYENKYSKNNEIKLSKTSKSKISKFKFSNQEMKSNIPNFYMTDAVSRNSKIMSECSLAFLKETK